MRNSKLEPVKFLIEDEADRSALGYIYVLRGAGRGHGWYKVGRSHDVDKRVGKLRRNLPFECELVYWYPIPESTPEIEFALHAELSEFRARGEWFHIPDESKICRVLEDFMGMCPAAVHEGYRLEEQHRRSLEIAKARMITAQKLREILDDGVGGVGDSYIDVVDDWDRLAHEINEEFAKSSAAAGKVALRQTYTYVVLEVSDAAYDEIAGKLREAGYDHVFDGEGKKCVMDMHGIAIGREGSAD